MKDAEAVVIERSSSSPSSSPESGVSRIRRRLIPRFGLRFLFVFAILFCLFFAWIGRNYLRLREEEAAIEALQQVAGAGFVFGDDEPQQTRPAGPSAGETIGRILGYGSRPPTREMHLRGEEADRKKVDKALAALALFPEIEDLHLTGPAFDDDAMAAAAKLPRLKHLNLERTGVTAKGLASLAPHVELRTIAVHAAADEAAFVRGLAPHTELRDVALAGIDVSRAEVAVLASLPKLETLRLQMSIPEGHDVFAPLAGAKGLKELQLDAVDFGDADVDPIGRSPSLETVSFVGLEAEDLARLNPSPTLREIRLQPWTEVDAAQAFSAAHPGVLVRCRSSHLWESLPEWCPERVERIFRDGEEVEP